VAVDEELWFGAQHDHAVAEDAASRSMAALVGRIIGAKPFPMTARRLADLTRQDVVRIEPVIQVLESDPGLSARLLRLVNSAGYALRQRCTSVRHAATLVGTDRLHQIATTAAVLNMFDGKGPVAAQIIEHSTVVGAFCRYLGAHLALPVDDLFTAGFLHDIGKLMLMETENEQYVELLTKCANKPDAIHHMERALYGFDHAVLAAHVLNAWNIPDPVPKIVAWHHEPAQAYKVSSMMAALVQTVRLADALVYVMQAEPEHQNIKELAQHESASYLDISEPQLAAMWDELQVLYNESREQCLGENAPALDPRSLRPKKPINASVAPILSERTHELPKQFPCVECGCPTFGNTCQACGGNVCPDHQVGLDGWCSLCARDYRTEKHSTPVPAQAKWVFGILAAAVTISGAAGMVSSGGAGAVRAGVGTLLLGSLVTLLYVVGKQWFFRSRFVRSRPNRFIPEPLLNDGGTQSLVPPEMHNTDRHQPAHSASAILKANVRLIEPLKEIAIREISDHDYGLPESSRSQSDPMGGPRLDSAPTSEPSVIDSARIRLQSNSLVTLPAPAAVETNGDNTVGRYSPSAANDSRRSPRDTLLERDSEALGLESESEHREASIGPTLTAQSAIAGFEAPHMSMEGNLSLDAEVDGDRARDTLCGPEFDRASADGTMLSSVSMPVASDGSELSSDDESLVRRMPLIGVVSATESNMNAVSSQRDTPIPTAPSGVLEQVKVEPREVLERAVSVHPLAVLGFKSEAPSNPVCDKSLETDPTPPATHTLGEVEPTEMMVAQPEGPRSERPNQLVAQSLNPSVQAELPSKVRSGADDIIESLIERSAAQFGEQFEARVSELVAQRVAELVAERMLRAFGTAVPEAAEPQAEKRKASAARSAKGNGAVERASASSRPARKARRRTKSPKLSPEDVQDEK
jgi:putative nucleotidyltransferase with HDIG domain